MPLEKKSKDAPVERLFPFVLRARLLVTGRPALVRLQKKLEFVLFTHDLSENSREEIFRAFRKTPLVRHYQSADLQSLFQLNNTKVIGFRKSPLAKTIFQSLKSSQIQNPFAES